MWSGQKRYAVLCVIATFYLLIIQLECRQTRIRAGRKHEKRQAMRTKQSKRDRPTSSEKNISHVPSSDVKDIVESIPPILPDISAFSRSSLPETSSANARMMSASTIAAATTAATTTASDFMIVEGNTTSAFSAADDIGQDNVTEINVPLETTSISKTTPTNRKTKITTLNQGKIRGFVEEIEPGKKVYVYLGIPYGESPEKENRFLPPKPIRPWNGTIDALEYGNSCHQWKDETFDKYEKGFRGTAMWNANTKLSEDCLYLNVWTPTSPRKSKNNKLAVVVWIFGGGFYSGTSSLDVYNGKWLASSQKIVVVSMNYRVGALGFLATGDEKLPGNAGLFDQRLALQWVKKYIKKFGGDPNRITLFGESAGAASISYHLLSEGSKQLFKNVILQSASFLSPWSFIDTKEAKRRTYKLAETLNCVNENDTVYMDENQSVSDEIVDCLRKISPQTLVNTEMNMEDFGIARFPNAVSLDGDFLKHSPFDVTNETYFNSDVNVLAGFNANEGNYFIIYSAPEYNFTTKNMIDKETFRKGISKALQSFPNVADASEQVQDVLVSNSHFMYTGGREPTKVQKSRTSGGTEKFLSTKDLSLHKNKKLQQGALIETFYRNRLDDLVGDINFVCPTIGLLDTFLFRQNWLGSSKRQAFLYKFVHRSTQNPWPGWMGVMHGYEIEFVFGLPLDPSRGYTELERNISHSMMRMWSNFAKYNDPNGKDPNKERMWPAYNQRNKFMYVIGENWDNNLSAKTSLYSGKYASQLTHCAFWQEHLPIMQEKLENIKEPCVRTVLAPPRGEASRIKPTYLLLTFLFLFIRSTFHLF